MKHLGSCGFALIMFVFCSLASCKKENLDGAWPPMEMDKDNITISVAGGSDTICLLNYPGWHLSGVSVRVNDTIVKRYPIWNGNDSVLYNMTGEWFSVRIPREAPQMLIVECQENTKLDRRELYVIVVHLDVCGAIHVYQSPFKKE